MRNLKLSQNSWPSRVQLPTLDWTIKNFVHFVLNLMCQSSILRWHKPTFKILPFQHQSLHIDFRHIYQTYNFYSNHFASRNNVEELMSFKKCLSSVFQDSFQKPCCKDIVWRSYLSRGVPVLSLVIVGTHCQRCVIPSSLIIFLA